MTCSEFLERYTDFRDGLVTAPRELRRFQRHMAQCPSCRMHDVALRHGVSALQDTDTVQPSRDFRRRLELRLERERALARPSLPARAPVAAALFVAVAIALLAMEGVRREGSARAPALPAVPFPKPVAQAGVPFVSFQDPRASVVISNPNPYGTALIEPIAAGR
jgi:hypothetical protein